MAVLGHSPRPHPTCQGRAYINTLTTHSHPKRTRTCAYVLQLQVRWFSFQFIVDEIVNELEEAFYACANVLRQLPYPIGN